MKELCALALKKFGTGLQAVKAMEECGEFIQAISKFFFRMKEEKKEKYLHNLAEEMADVLIMMEQIKIAANCADLVEEYKEKKLTRLKARLEDYE